VIDAMAAWSLWDRVSRKAKDFGRPNTFYGNIDENKWESFTLTTRGRQLLNRIVEFSGNEPGTGALMTFPQSKWLMSIVVPYQPHFTDMPRIPIPSGATALFIDEPGDYVDKSMAQCTDARSCVSHGSPGIPGHVGPGAGDERCDYR